VSKKAKKCDGHHIFSPGRGAGSWGVYRRSTQRETIMIRIRIGVLTVAGLLVGAQPMVAFAQFEETPERRAACMADAIMLCSSAIPNKARIASCLASKKSQLSPQCRAQFASR
jgi:hypothetical protein